MTVTEPESARRIRKRPNPVSPAAQLTTVTVCVPASVGAQEADLVAEFLAWTPFPLERHADGSFSAELKLEKRHRWRYQYLIDGDHFINDWCADDYSAGTEGTVMSVLHT